MRLSGIMIKVTVKKFRGFSLLQLRHYLDSNIVYTRGALGLKKTIDSMLKSSTDDAIN